MHSVLVVIPLFCSIGVKMRLLQFGGSIGLLPLRGKYVRGNPGPLLFPQSKRIEKLSDSVHLPWSYRSLFRP